MSLLYYIQCLLPGEYRVLYAGKYARGFWTCQLDNLTHPNALEKWSCCLYLFSLRIKIRK